MQHQMGKSFIKNTAYFKQNLQFKNWQNLGESRLYASEQSAPWKLVEHEQNCGQLPNDDVKLYNIKILKQLYFLSFSSSHQMSSEKMIHEICSNEFRKLY